MSYRVRVLVRKEWAELIRRRVMVVLMAVLPAGLLAIATAGALVLPVLMSEKRAQEDPDIARAFEMIKHQAPDLAAMGPQTAFGILLLRQILLLLLLVPIIVSMSVAAYSIVGEKVNRSLEPLLATPISTRDLLLGKALASVIPGVGLTWVLFGLFAGGIAAFAPEGVFGHVVNLTALSVMFLLCPAISLLALSVVIITSSRSSDPRSAQQIGAVVVIPIVCIITAQMSGLFLLTPMMVAVGTLVLAVLDYFVLRAGVALFQREVILTKWGR